MRRNKTPRPEPSALDAPDSIRAILDEFLHEGIEAACNAAYIAGFEDGYRRASEELRQGLEEELRQGLEKVSTRVIGRRTERVDHQPSDKRLPRPLTKREREYVEYVAQFPNGLTATEYRTQTGRADVGLYKLEKRGVLVKQGPRFHVPIPSEPNPPLEG